MLPRTEIVLTSIQMNRISQINRMGFHRALLDGKGVSWGLPEGKWGSSGLSWNTAGFFEGGELELSVVPAKGQASC